MKRAPGVLAVFLLLGLLACILESTVQAEPEPPGSSPNLRLVASTPQEMVITLTLDDYDIGRATDKGQPQALLHVPGLGLSIEPGKPQLPVRGLVLGIPPEAKAHLEVLEAIWATVPERLHIPPAPVARPFQEPLLPGIQEPWAVADAPLQDLAIYERDAFYPKAPVELIEVGFIRHQRVAMVRLSPAQYNPVSGQVRLATRLTFRLALSYPGGMRPEAWTAAAEPGGFERLLKDTLLNYESARVWRMPRAPAPDTPDAQGPPSTAGSYKLIITDTGIYELTYADLVAAGFTTAPLQPHRIQVFHMDSEVPLLVESGEDGSFGPGDYFLFYGEAFEDKYTAQNVYWLTYDQGEGLRMAPRDVYPSGGQPVPSCFQASLHAEENAVRLAILPVPDIDFERWMWQAGTLGIDMTASAGLSQICSSGIASMVPSLYGYTTDAAVNPDHHVQFKLNGIDIGETSWEGRIIHTATISFPTSILQEGNNEFRIVTPGDTGSSLTEISLLDWIEIEYPHRYVAEGDRLFFGVDSPGIWEFHVGGFTTQDLELFDISDPYATVHLDNHALDPGRQAHTLRFSDTVVSTATRYLAQTPLQRLKPADILADSPSSLKSPTNRADYLVIAPADFYAEAARLANYRNGQGRRTVAIELQDVYDEFSGGRANIHAIEDLIAYAFAFWQAPPPSHVLLLGDGTYDYKDLLGLAPGRKNYMPPYEAPVDIQADYPRLQIPGEAAADNRYVCVSGGDLLPDLHLGRLPANSPAEARAMVDKIMAYEAASPADWQSRLLFIADNRDAGGNFPYFSNVIIDNHLPTPPYGVTRVYVETDCATGPQCKQQVIDGYNAGHLALNYVGHASRQQWATENLLKVTDISALTNAQALPIQLSWSCSDGKYDIPDVGSECLAETFVVAEGKGAIAAFSGTGAGLAAGHDYLNRGFFDAVFYDGVRDLGLATYYAKLRLWSEGGSFLYDLLDTYLLFGDPVLHIQALDTDLQLDKTVEPAGELFPGDTVTYTLSFTNAGPGLAHRIILTDLIPANLLSPTVIYSSPEVISRYIGVTFTWAISDLLPNMGGIIRFRAVVNPAAEPGVWVVNEATISSLTPETNPGNNTAWTGLIPVYLPLVLQNHP